MMNNNFNSSGILTLGEVSKIIMIDSIPSVKKWLKSKNITMNKISKSYYVYEVEITCELERQLALNLRRNYPTQWKEMYKCVSRSESIYNLVLIQIGEEVVHKPIYKVKTRGTKDEKLLQELLSI
jgi:hypothetical protein